MLRLLRPAGARPRGALASLLLALVVGLAPVGAWLHESLHWREGATVQALPGWAPWVGPAAAPAQDTHDHAEARAFCDLCVVLAGMAWAPSAPDMPLPRSPLAVAAGHAGAVAWAPGAPLQGPPIRAPPPSQA
jgi:hypothetical protein